MRYDDVIKKSKGVVKGSCKMIEHKQVKSRDTIQALISHLKVLTSYQSFCSSPKLTPKSFC